jgi:hypothetical protein
MKVLPSTRLMAALNTSLTANVTGQTDIYGYFAPDSAVFPWITMIPLASPRVLMLLNTPQFADITVQFSVFDNSMPTTAIQAIQGQLEGLLHANLPNVVIPSVAGEPDMHVIWSRKIGEPMIISGPKAENFFRQGVQTFQFRVQIQPG